MKKLLAGLLIGGLFSLGCSETTKTTPVKEKTTPPKMKPVDKEEGKMKDEGTKTEPKKDDSKPEPKKDDSKKPDKKDAK